MITTEVEKGSHMKCEIKAKLSFSLKSYFLTSQDDLTTCCLLSSMNNITPVFQYS
jgi:hypothetical protein